MKNNIAVFSLCIAAMFFCLDCSAHSGETPNYDRPPVLLLCIAAMFLRQLEAPRSPLAPLYCIEGSN